MNYQSKSRATEVAKEMNEHYAYPKAWVVFHRDAYWTVICSYCRPIGFGEVYDA